MAKTTKDYQRLRRDAERHARLAISRVKRAMTSLELWQRRERYYAAQLAIDDDERAAIRAARLAKAKAKAAEKPAIGKRRIKVEGE